MLGVMAAKAGATSVVGVDVLESPCLVARRTAALNGVADRVSKV
jgi:23S rRNA G2069 N7-methylase RlmK/C1962 C5-methylase RlmI